MNDVFVPWWEGEKEDFFKKIDYSRYDTPCYLIHDTPLKENLSILHHVKEQTGCKILLALKSFAAWHSFPLIRQYLDGVCASSVYEARLGRELFKGEVHSYSPGYTPDDIEGQIRYADHLIFNSLQQWRRYRPMIDSYNKGADKKILCGLRINPHAGKAPPAFFSLYSPCVKGSRLGIDPAELVLEKDELDKIDLLHFHALCEQGLDPLREVVARVEELYPALLRRVRYVNFGGGHHITRHDYDVEGLCSLINSFKKRYDLQVILEPGEAVALNAGVLVTSVVDILERDHKIAILDTSAEAHTPDVLAMPYRPQAIGAAPPDTLPHTYTLGGLTCLAGDLFGEYSFREELQTGDRVVFMNMAIYTMVKNSFFNGVRMPDILHLDEKGEVYARKQFHYEDFINRLG